MSTMHELKWTCPKPTASNLVDLVNLFRLRLSQREPINQENEQLQMYVLFSTFTDILLTGHMITSLDSEIFDASALLLVNVFFDPML